jgi:hypothetical protein
MSGSTEMKQASETTPLPRKLDANYVLNPATKRYVKKTTPTGKAVMQRMSRGELVDHINKHASTEMLKYRDLLRSDISDDELAKILKKLVDVKITESVARENFIPKLKPLKQQRKKKPKPTKSKVKSSTAKRGRPKKSLTASRSTAQSPLPRGKSKKRFVVKPPPVSEFETTDFDTATDVYTESDYSE